VPLSACSRRGAADGWAALGLDVESRMLLSTD
jgi:hypothetical protein